MSKRSARRKRKKGSTLAATATQTNPFPWLLGGREKPETRGVDERNSRADLNAQQIDTERHRDPIVFRAVDYFDKLPLGTGINLESDNDTILLAARRFWRANDLEAVQHQVAIELAQTAMAVAHLPKDVPPEGLDSLGYTPTVELVPTGQVKRIATKHGKPWYFRREWEDREYPEPNGAIEKGRTPLVGMPVQYQQDIPAEDIVYTAINRGARELRGVSMLQPALYWTKLYARTLKMIYVHSVAKAFLAFQVKIQGMEEGSEAFKDLKTRLEDSLINQLDPSGEEYKALATGQALITGQNVDVAVLNSKVGADSQDDEKRRLLLQAAVATGLPEVFLSDGNYANLASSMSQSNPFFRLMQSHQATLVEFFRKVFEKAFDRYLEAGWFKDVALEPGMVHISDYLKISAPDILTPDIATLGPVVTQLTAGGNISLQQGAELLGRDWEETKEQLLAEKAEGLTPPSPATPGFPSLPFSRTPTGFEQENRDDTGTLAERMERKSARAIAHFRNQMIELSGSKDRTKAMELYLTLVKKLKAIMNDSLDEGRKFGLEEGETEAAKLPPIEEEVAA
uniref:Putative portal protein n=1 Tax=viral metagenome TaxID=1070528 RepID=A0A6M3K2X7_9ZZZZ